MGAGVESLLVLLGYQSSFWLVIGRARCDDFRGLSVGAPGCFVLLFWRCPCLLMTVPPLFAAFAETSGQDYRNKVRKITRSILGMFTAVVSNANVSL